MSGLLDGMRVLDTSFWRPMGHATQILADLGAEVVMIEPPGGVPMRAYPQIFAGIARHKRSVELALGSLDVDRAVLDGDGDPVRDRDRLHTDA